MINLPGGDYSFQISYNVNLDGHTFRARAVLIASGKTFEEVIQNARNLAAQLPGNAKLGAFIPGIHERIP